MDGKRCLGAFERLIPKASLLNKYQYSTDHRTIAYRRPSVKANPLGGEPVPDLAFFSAFKYPYRQYLKAFRGRLKSLTSKARVISPRLSEVKEESIVTDMNHPLAGRDLRFDVRVVSIE